MDLRQLKYFSQIAELGSFSRAADTLRISQPSLSQQIRNLEDELGVQLLTRHARGASLTELGEQFYDHARNILNGVDQATDAIRSKSALPSGRISVGLPTSAARSLSLPLFKAVSAEMPNIAPYIVESMSGYLDDLVQTGRLDVALLYNHQAYEYVAWTEMIAEDLMLFAAADSRQQIAPVVDFQSLFDLPLVLPDRKHILRSILERLAVRHDRTFDALDCDSLPAIAQLVKSEDYCTVMPHFAFLDELTRGEMVAFPIVNPTPSWSLSVVVSERTLNPRGSEAVARILARVVSDLVEAGTWRARLKGDAANRSQS